MASLVFWCMQVRVQSDPAGRLVITGQPEQLDNPWGITPFKKVFLWYWQKKLHLLFFLLLLTLDVENVKYLIESVSGTENVRGIYAARHGPIDLLDIILISTI